VYPCTARSQRESDSPVVSETAGSQRGVRGREMAANSQSCKLINCYNACTLYVFIRDWWALFRNIHKNKKH